LILHFNGGLRGWVNARSTSQFVIIQDGLIPVKQAGKFALRARYKVTEAGGIFVEVPTKTVKPSQTCPNCGHQHKKTLDERIHQCGECGFTMDRDLAAALVMLLCSHLAPGG
jgi:ribosomal protein S27AE